MPRLCTEGESHRDFGGGNAEFGWKDWEMEYSRVGFDDRTRSGLLRGTLLEARASARGEALRAQLEIDDAMASVRL